MIWTLRRLARRPELALGASALVAGVTLLVSGENVGRPFGWGLMLTLFLGGTVSGMGIAKAKREWHDAWVRETFGDIVISSPHENAEYAMPGGVVEASGNASSDAPSTVPNSSADRILRLPHDGPDSDIILSLPHGSEAGASGGSESLN